LLGVLVATKIIYIRLTVQQIGNPFHSFSKFIIIMNDDKLLLKLSQNLLEILNDEKYYDITIEVGNDPSIKIFHAHMVILHYRSTYLRSILSIYEKKNDGIMAHIKLPNILPEIFQIILR
jgi:hypothetical protein